jgi:hypothetical protein
VKPVMSFLLARQELASAVLAPLAEYFGPPDLVGPWGAFEATSYYTPEMGPQLGRLMVSFLHLAHPGSLADWKGFTNRVEHRFSLGGRRLVNLDPGYITPARLVLATGKNYSHRIYLDQGIYGELTLHFSQGKFQHLPWTYPDYAQGELPEFLGQVREKYLWQLKAYNHICRKA